MGVPAHRTSIPVVCPLHRGVSRQTSASWPLLTCSSLGATGEKMIRFWGRPIFCAYCWILGSPTAGKRNSQSTLLGTRFRIFKKGKRKMRRLIVHLPFPKSFYFTLFFLLKSILGVWWCSPIVSAHKALCLILNTTWSDIVAPTYTPGRAEAKGSYIQGDPVSNK